MRPEEIIAAVVTKPNFLGCHMEELRRTLELPGISAIVESGFLQAEDLVKTIFGQTTVLPVAAAKRVILIYDKIKKLDAFR